MYCMSRHEASDTGSSSIPLSLLVTTLSWTTSFQGCVCTIGCVLMLTAHDNTTASGHSGCLKIFLTRMVTSHGMLSRRYDPSERITAQQALVHRYFDPIRHLIPPREPARPPAERYVQPGYEDYVYEEPTECENETKCESGDSDDTSTGTSTSTSTSSSRENDQTSSIRPRSRRLLAKRESSRK
jgi:hypothetical protein